MSTDNLNQSQTILKTLGVRKVMTITNFTTILCIISTKYRSIIETIFQICTIFTNITLIYTNYSITIALSYVKLEAVSI